MVRGECRALRYGDLADAEGVSPGVQSPSRRLITRPAESSNSACLIEIIVECCRCGLASMAGWRIRASVVATGPQPARSEVVSASSQDSDRGHDVSILMALIGPVGL